MGKEKKVTKNMKGISGLDYVEIQNVPMIDDPEYGPAVHSQVLGEVEKMVAKELILRRYQLRGKEVKFIRSILGLSQREFAGKLKLSHVSILKWEKASTRILDLVNEVAVKAMLSGYLKLRIPVSLESLVGDQMIPKKLTLNYEMNEAY